MLHIACNEHCTIQIESKVDSLQLSLLHAALQCSAMCLRAKICNVSQGQNTGNKFIMIAKT